MSTDMMARPRNTFQGKSMKIRKKRKAREGKWSNPPYNLNVKTNVGKKFLSLVKKYFIKGGKIDETYFIKGGKIDETGNRTGT